MQLEEGKDSKNNENKELPIPKGKQTGGDLI